LKIGPCVYEFFQDWYPVEVININSGMSVIYSFNTLLGHWKTHKVDPDIRIDFIYLYPSGDAGYLETFGPDPADAPRMEWHGYGEYENPSIK
jgi:hypothetical protein